MNFIFDSLGQFIAWLTVHSSLAYLILFLGAYFETLIGPSLVVPGEIFFLAGGILSSTGVLHIWLVAPVVYLGAILGDNTSYFLGHHFGSKVFQPGRWIFNPKNYEKGERFFHRYGPRAVFFARLLGPLSWITPFLAGIYRVPYPKFFAYNVAGVLVGVTEFLAVGYFFGGALTSLLSPWQRYALLTLGIALFLGFLYWQSRAEKRESS